MQITIGGVPGAGKSTAAKLVAEKLGYDFYSMGKIRRELAEERGLTIDEFNSLPENTDAVVDERQKTLGREGDNFVNEGRLAFYFMPNSVKIYFHCDINIAASRIFKEPRSSERVYADIAGVVLDLQKRMQSDRERYSGHYNIDCYNPAHFDYVIDTTNLAIDETLEKVLEIVKKKRA